jgi:hypothetical protein
MTTEPLPVISLSAEVLSRTPPEAIDLIVRLLAQVDALRGLTVAAEARVKELAARVEALEAKLNKNSSNSNKPPSSDSPFAGKTEQAKPAQTTKKGKCSRGKLPEIIEFA